MKKLLTRGMLAFALLAFISTPLTSAAFWQNFTHSISIGASQTTQSIGQVLGAASGLTESQIQSILSLLRSFGAEAGILSNVERSLRGTSGGTAVPYTPPPSTTSSLVVSTSPASDGYRLVAAGTQNVVIGTYNLQALAEPVRLTKLMLKLTSGSSTDVGAVTIWKGNTKVGEVYFSGNQTTATSTLLQPVNIPANSSEGLTIKADLSPIGVVQAVNASGHLVQIDYLNGEAYESNSGTRIYPTGSTNVAGVRVMKSFPTVSLDALPSTGLTDGRLMRFKVTASPSGPISLANASFTVNKNVTLSNISLFGFTDSNYSQPVSGVSPDGNVQITNDCPTGCSDANLSFGVRVTNSSGSNSFVQVPAGATRYFELRGSVSNVTSNSYAHTTLRGDSSFSMGIPYGKDLGFFLWSPNSLTTSPITNEDWTNGYGVPGLPPNGLTQTRSNGTSATENGTINGGTFTTATPTLSGSASGTNTVGFSIGDGGKVYGSGTINVVNGTWSHTVNTPLANGTYSVTLYGSHNNALSSTNITIQAPTSTDGPKSNAMSCSNPRYSNLGTGSVACYGLWDYGNEFGNDQDMCDDGSYGTPRTGCTVTTNACSSGKATATKYYIINSTSASDIQTIATYLRSTPEVVKAQLIRVWDYTCDASVSSGPTVTGTGYHEGRFYVRSTLSDAGEAHRTLYRGTTVIIGGKTYIISSNTGVGNIYIPNSADGVVKLGDSVEMLPPTATVTGTGYHEGKFYVKTSQSGVGGVYRTLGKGDVFLIGGRSFTTTTGTGVGNIYLSSSAESAIQLGWPVEKQ